jgi:hypothetical protein
LPLVTTCRTEGGGTRVAALALRRPAIRIALGDLDRTAAAFVGEQLPDLPAAGHGKQAEFTVTEAAAEVVKHQVQVGTGRPFRFGHAGLPRSAEGLLRTLARERGILVLDLEREILSRRPHDWFGTLMDRIIKRRVLD